MPPRKSNVSVASGGGEEAPDTPTTATAATVAATAAGTPAATPGKDKDKDKKEKEKDELTVEDLTLPRTMVQRLAKGVLPPNTQLQRDAATAISKSATVFISHLATAAQEHTATANRKTMSPADVFAALRDTEHERMVPRLEAELARFVEAGASKRNEYRRKLKERASAGGEGEREEDEGGEREAKRVKGEEGVAVAAQGEEGDEMMLDEGDGDGEGEAEEDEEDEDEDEGDETEEDDEAEAEDDAEDPAAAQLARESRAMDPEADASSESD